MAFGKSKEQKTAEMMRKFGLGDIKDPKIKEIVQGLSGDINANKWYSLGAAISLNSEISAMTTGMNIIQNQNWIMIRQLDKMNTLLEQIAKK